ncbi:translation initiation factor IF-2-like [Choloepus didactylus]|uniref:translation initiation factor IF-2-like n=1 Tax=Choloepus didactylus TaxID=27675 RepID=UPI00189EC6E8|nr:translation initiation factor IF-2-like [Choloepus didactylus]
MWFGENVARVSFFRRPSSGRSVQGPPPGRHLSQGRGAKPRRRTSGRATGVGSFASAVRNVPLRDPGSRAVGGRSGKGRAGRPGGEGISSLAAPLGPPHGSCSSGTRPCSAPRAAGGAESARPRGRALGSLGRSSSAACRGLAFPRSLRPPRRAPRRRGRGFAPRSWASTNTRLLRVQRKVSSAPGGRGARHGKQYVNSKQTVPTKERSRRRLGARLPRLPVFRRPWRALGTRLGPSLRPAGQTPRTSPGSPQAAGRLSRTGARPSRPWPGRLRETGAGGAPQEALGTGVRSGQTEVSGEDPGARGRVGRQQMPARPLLRSARGSCDHPRRARGLGTWLSASPEIFWTTGLSGHGQEVFFCPKDSKTKIQTIVSLR